MYRLVLGWLLAFSVLAPPGALAANGPPDLTFPEQVLGNPKAPVRIDEFGMLTCPHCADFSTDTLPKLKADYIDTGKVKLVFHDVATNQIAVEASVMAHCLPPERFFPMVETLYKTQEQWVQATEAASVAALKQEFKFAGVSDDRLNACLADKAMEATVLKNTIDASNMWKVAATPTFFFNGDMNSPIVGTKPYAELKARIDALLPK